MHTSLFALALLLFILGTLQTARAQEPSIQGAWAPERYVLKSGDEHTVTGLIFFAEQDWGVLFFVMGEDDTPQRGSGEGGTYEVKGDSLIFTHYYHVSGGAATGSLAESPLRMELHDTADAPREPCTIDLDGDHLTIHFPSGNAMTFRRRPGMDG